MSADQVADGERVESPQLISIETEMKNVIGAFAFAACGSVAAMLPWSNVSTLAAQQMGFQPGCPLPFEAIKFKHPIDNSCSSDGEGSARAVEQNKMKNNFCASGVPRPVTVARFRQLQNASGDFPAGGPNSPATDRSIYHVQLPSGTWKEGDLVRLVGFVVDAHFSNTDSGGENVNCNHDGDSWNDIHIAVAPTKSEDDLCKAVVVEMSPHYRPKAWTEITHFAASRPMRFTGPLFFDANHKACTPAKRSKPPRVSSW